MVNCELIRLSFNAVKKLAHLGGFELGKTGPY